MLIVILKIFLKNLVIGTRTPWRNAWLPYLGQEMNTARLEHLVIPEGEVLPQRLLAAVRRTLKPTSLDSQQPKLGCMHTGKIKLPWNGSYWDGLMHQSIYRLKLSMIFRVNKGVDHGIHEIKCKKECMRRSYHWDGRPLTVQREPGDSVLLFIAAHAKA